MFFGKKRCEKHADHYFVWTSPGLAEAISHSRAVSRDKIHYLYWNFGGHDLEYVVDSAFLEKFGMPSNQSVVVLKDRNKELEQLNDRLLILQARKVLERVCPVCLDCLIDPSGENQDR